ncbi:MAG: formylglycine-generating enzyme family protein [Myxococcales bacterium]|nr:formylglycine-generating enzyme family protein [Myxococcales bacterium]
MKTRITVSATTVLLAFGAACTACPADPARPSGLSATSEPPCGASLDTYDMLGKRIAGAGDAGCCKSTFDVAADCHHPTVNKDCRDGWCRVPAGCFVMGSPQCAWGRGRHGEPETQVTLTHAFEIQQYEMTQAQWMSLGFENPGGAKDGFSDCIAPNCPVGNVTLFDALEAANRLSAAHDPPLPACYTLRDCSGTAGNKMVCEAIGQTVASLYDCTGYRLPTEAEWEYAARAGTRTAFYSGDIRPVDGCKRDENLERIGWYCFNANRSTHPVGKKEPNAWGLHDMAGNVEEWVSGTFNGLGYGPSPQVDPGAVLHPTSGSRILRGGVFYAQSQVCRSSKRGQSGGHITLPGVGLRLVRTVF